MQQHQHAHSNADVMTAFADYQAGRGFAAVTVNRRATSLRSLARHLAPTPLTAVTFADLEEWLAGFPSPRTRSAYRSDVRTWAKWATRRKVIAADPTLDLDPVRIPRSLPRPVDAALIRHLIVTAPDIDTRLMIAWARHLAATGEVDRARWLAQRLREFRNPDAQPFFAPCEGGASVEFQCQPPETAHDWREFARLPPRVAP